MLPSTCSGHRIFLRRHCKSSYSLLKWMHCQLVYGSRMLTTSLPKHSKVSDFEEMDEDEGSTVDELLLWDREYNKTFQESYLLPSGGHRVFVIQPEVKWGPSKPMLTTADLQIAEACALVDSLPRWNVVEKAIYTLKYPSHKKTLYGKGTLEELSKRIRGSPGVSAVFLSVDILSGIQLATLQKKWRLPVYDRYTIVLQIFQVRARTKEARIQVALAGIPYLRSRLRGMHQGSLDQQRGALGAIGGSGETHLETRQRILQEQETKLRRALTAIQGKREMTRRERSKRELPIVAVVGYTNAGKTSLIKALTGEQDLAPRDQLFATLDVTAHASILPNHMKVLLLDTVGFISNIPTSLIQAFNTTMEDALKADVILHVCDISHPDYVCQHHNVLQTLASLDLPQSLAENIVNVRNKIDLVDRETSLPESENCIHVSATEGTGLLELRAAIQDLVISSTGRLQKRIRIPQSGSHLSWLYKHATVESTHACEDNPEALLVDALFTEAMWAKFSAQYGKRGTKS